MKALSDHNMEGRAVLLWGTLSAEGWVDLLSFPLVTFADVGLAPESNDREVWRFAQANDLILLTGNRNMVGKNSLEQTLREENTPQSLPVITVGNVDRILQYDYRMKCMLKLVEIVMDIDKHKGVGRIFIP